MVSRHHLISHVSLIARQHTVIGYKEKGGTTPFTHANIGNETAQTESGFLKFPLFFFFFSYLASFGLCRNVVF